MSAEIPQVLRQLLGARGMDEAAMRSFLYPDYATGLHDPFLMSDMEPAVERILQAREAGERVVVYGDYDIDGITATAVMLEVLGAIGVQASGYIPDRFEEGYGINQAALEQLQADGAALVISVDCGITSVAEAAWAREHGLDLIITDHHTLPPVIPEAVAVLNPKKPDDDYPFKDLAGVGVAFKLAQALQIATSLPPEGHEKWWLDLVAMGTICDIVPLVGENRVLASFGLKVLRKTRRVGLRALCEVAGVKQAKLRAYDVGYLLGPRMNAAGRLDNAARSLELVMTQDTARAREIAAELEAMNLQRRHDQDVIFKAADAMAQQFADDPVLVLADEAWSHGVVGIVASKLAEKWKRPVLLGQVLGENVKGSARSVAGFDMVSALKANAELLSKFGGHYFAAGYTLPHERWADLREGLKAHHARVMTDTAGEGVELPVDLQWDGLGGVSLDLVTEFELLEPFGNMNPQPRVKVSGLKLTQRRGVGTDGKHLSVKMADDGGGVLGGIGFGLTERYADLAVGDRVTVVGHLGANEFQGRTSLQMVLSELHHE